MGELKGALPWLRFDEASFNFNVVSVEQWAGALRNALSDPMMNTLNRSMGEVAVPIVEGKWRERFREYFRNGTTEFEAIAGDLFCAAAWTGLSILLNLDLSEVTIANWSDLILWSLADFIDFPSQPSPSTIFGFPALFQLGFGKFVTDAVNDGRLFREPSVVASKFQSLTQEQGEISEWVFSASVRKSAAEMPGVLVVLDSPNPPPDWKISEKYSVVVVRKKDLFLLRQALQGLWTQSMFSRVVVEVAPTPQTSVLSSAAARRSRLRVPRGVELAVQLLFAFSAARRRCDYIAVCQLAENSGRSSGPGDPCHPADQPKCADGLNSRRRRRRKRESTFFLVNAGHSKS